MKITTKILVACLPGIVTGALFAASTGERADSKTKANEANVSKAKASMGRLPLSFEPNRGQTDSQVQFLSRGPGYTVFFTKDGTVLSLKDTNTSTAVVRMKFVGGTNSATAQPLEAQPGVSNYLKGNDPAKWYTGIESYTKLRYENVYPGIDVVYQGDHQQLRYDFIVKPGASASSIAMAFEGADKIAVTKDGDLALTIDGKTLITKKPFTYQEDAGAKKEVASHFVVKDNRVTFELAKYDTTKDVVIDPTVVFITYLGGLLNDSVNGVAIVNPSQSVSSQPSFFFVTGTTASTNFPTTMGVLATGLTGDNDVFVTEFNYTGTTLKWSTYLGGNSQDSGAAIAVDLVSNGCTVSGCPVVVGQTFSANFPTLPFASSSLSGTDDAFVSKFNQTGTLIYSTYLGGTTNDQATGVAVDGLGTAYVGGYTDSAQFPLGCSLPNCANHGVPTSSSDAFVVRIPASWTGTPALATAVTTPSPAGCTGTSTGCVLSTLYGGFGEEFSHALAYNPTSNMVYIGGDTTTAAQNFIAPNNVNLPGITNQTALTGLPGAGPQARGGFIAAFDALSLVKTFASYVAVSPATGTTCGIAGQNTTCSQGTESIEGIAAEGGFPASGCTGIGVGGSCTVVASHTQIPTAATLCSAGSVTGCISQGYGNSGHAYITGLTTSNVPSANIAVVVPGFACASGLIATDGSSAATAGDKGVTNALGCTTALVTQAPFNKNWAPNATCAYPLVTTTPPTATCNYSAFVAIVDDALLIQPVTGANVAPIGNQIEYWAYYSSVAVTGGVAGPNTYALGNSSAQSNAIAIDTNPTTGSTVYSLGYFQQMYITGSTQLTTSGAGNNELPVTNTTANTNGNNPETSFTPYNVGTTGGGGVGGLTIYGSNAVNEVDAFVARFNPNGLAAAVYGGAINNGGGSSGLLNPCAIPNPGTGITCDRSPLIHTPQFNYGEFLYAASFATTSSTGLPANHASTADGSLGNTVGNAIAVDVTRAAIVGGATNNSQTKVTTPAGANSTFACPLAGGQFANVACLFTTTNFLGSTPSGGQNNGGTDGWVSVLFFNDILTDAPAAASANPFLEPPFGPSSPNNTYPGPLTFTSGVQTGGANTTYIETTPPPFGPTFDFAISDPSTQTQTFQVIFTGQTAGQILAPTPFFVPLDFRSGATQPMTNNGQPGSAVVYYLPCYGPGSNPYPAPGGPYTPLGTIVNGASSCTIPVLYPEIYPAFSGWPSANPNQTTGSTSTIGQGWLLVSQDINPGVVRLQLDRRAAAGLLEGTYVAQFLVTTLDPRTNTQWPPCGPFSVLQPFQTTTPTCANPATPLPADNVSILVTVRLVVRPTLYLSRNAGLLTGITGNLQVNPIVGATPVPAAGFNGLNQEDGTSPVPTWLFADSNSTLTQNNLAPNNVNAAQPVCVPSLVAGTNYPTLTAAGLVVNLPCVAGVTPAAPPNGPSPPSPYKVGATPSFIGAAAYNGNGPGDLSGGAIGAAPVMNFFYDAGTIQTPSIAAQQGLVTSRPDCPGVVNSTNGTCAFNSDFQGGFDPATQRNDATVHDYYVADGPTPVEGPATLSVEAVGCTNWNNTTQNPAVGNWLSVQFNLTGPYIPICSTTDTSSTVGSHTAPALFTAIGNDPYCPPGGGVPSCTASTAGGPFGQQIPLDFKTMAFSDRQGANGIPPGLYTAQVFVWSTRAKNSVPGYCLGESAPATGASGIDPNPLCGTGTTDSAAAESGASDGNPHPQVVVTSGQWFTVNLFVFDTTQIVQITPNSCPTGGFAGGTPVTQFVTVANSENLFTGNPLTGFGSPFVPPVPLSETYPQFGPNADSLAVFSLLPFQTTGASITAPCPSNNTATCPGGTGTNVPIPLPAGVTVNPQTLAQYNSCAIPTGTFNGTAITGVSVPGVGTLQLTGAQSQTVFVPGGTGTNANVTIYACRPTVAPAWLATTLTGVGLTNSAGLVYPGNSLTAFSGAPEEYANGNGPFGGSPVTSKPGGQGDNPKFASLAAGTGPVPSVSSQTCPLSGTSVGGGGGQVMFGTKVGIVRNNAFNFDSNGNEIGPAPTDPADRVDSFIPPGGVQAGDIPVTGDWTGDGHAKAGWFRPTGGQWFLDAANTGVYSVGSSLTYSGFGGTGDVPVVGDWSGLGKSSIGVFTGGFLWVLDLSYNGVFVQPFCAQVPPPGVTPTYPNCGADPIFGDAVFPFGGIPGDVPVVGNWSQKTSTTGFAISQAGIVRAFCPGTPCLAPQSAPFLWMLDSAVPGTSANVTPPSSHGNVGPSIAFGGLAGDIPVTGDWNNIGVTQFGDFRQGFLWVLDAAQPAAPQSVHVPGFVFPYGGLAGDKPVVGKW